MRRVRTYFRVPLRRRRLRVSRPSRGIGRDTKEIGPSCRASGELTRERNKGEFRGPGVREAVSVVQWRRVRWPGWPVFAAARRVTRHTGTEGSLSPPRGLFYER